MHAGNHMGIMTTFKKPTAESPRGAVHGLQGSLNLRQSVGESPRPPLFQNRA
jgi:hypothetical protein